MCRISLLTFTTLAFVLNVARESLNRNSGSIIVTSHIKLSMSYMFEIRKQLCGLCLIGKIVPEHCTTIPKAAL